MAGASFPMSRHSLLSAELRIASASDKKEAACRDWSPGGGVRGAGVLISSHALGASCGPEVGPAAAWRS